ncbi:MAG: hypothetical protein FWH05_08160 [Oscillospiraceae bacterium]|nr:hypothetical protein [Oscillospiraceae bacterium]
MSIAIDAAHYDMSDPRFIPGEYDGRQAVIWENQSGDVTYRFDVLQSGDYSLRISYFPLSANTARLKILINGEFPFGEEREFLLEREWIPQAGILKDRLDNDLPPPRTGLLDWSDFVVKDDLSRPLSFSLESGENTITLRGDRVFAAIDGLTFTTFDTSDSIDSLKADAALAHDTPPIVVENHLKSNTILIEGETPHSVNSPSLVGMSDSSTPHLSPSHPVKRRINTIRADNNADKLTYQFGVPHSGYYRFTFKVKQDNKSGLPSYRRIWLNGEVPCFEFEAYEFPYSDSWYKETLRDYSSAHDIFLFIEQGTNYLTLETIPGPRVEIFTAALEGQFAVVKSLVEELSPYGANVGVIQMLINRASAGSLTDDDFSLFEDWLEQISDNPLEIDYIEVSTVHSEPKSLDNSILSGLAFNFSHFAGGFSEKARQKETVLVMVKGGADSVGIINRMAEQKRLAQPEFPMLTAVVAGGSLHQTLLSPNKPDLYFFADSDEICRAGEVGLVSDLAEFSGYHSIIERFSPNAMADYIVGDKIYGLSLTKSTGAVIFEQSALRDEAWEVLSWFTEDNTQFEYCLTIEQTSPTQERIQTANQVANKQLTVDN